MIVQDVKIELMSLNMLLPPSLVPSPMLDTQGVLSEYLPKDQLCLISIFTSCDTLLAVPGASGDVANI